MYSRFVLLCHRQISAHTHTKTPTLALTLTLALTHSCARTGARAILRLLAFAPPSLGACPASLASADPVDRPVQYCPAAGEKLDPRAAIAGG